MKNAQDWRDKWPNKTGNPEFNSETNTCKLQALAGILAVEDADLPVSQTPFTTSAFPFCSGRGHAEAGALTPSNSTWLPVLTTITAATSISSEFQPRQTDKKGNQQEFLKSLFKGSSLILGKGIMNRPTPPAGKGAEIKQK